MPLVLWPLPPPPGLTTHGWQALLVVLGAALGWLLEPLPDYLVALLMAVGWEIAGLAPPALIFAGFASSGWFVALGALALAAAMVRSGPVFRIALLSLSAFPPTRVGQILALLVSGVLITPLVPLGLARVAAVAPWPVTWRGRSATPPGAAGAPRSRSPAWSATGCSGVCS